MLYLLMAINGDLREVRAGDMLCWDDEMTSRSHVNCLLLMAESSWLTTGLHCSVHVRPFIAP